MLRSVNPAAKARLLLWGMTIGSWFVVQGSLAEETVKAQNPPTGSEFAALHVQFANRDEATKELQAADGFFTALSRFDLQVRLQSGEEVTIEDLKQRIAASTLDWTDEERAKVQEVVDAVQPRLSKWRLPLPEKIWLAKTNGQEDADSPYTRGATIVFPQRVLKQTPAELQRLFMHELFHILSRNNPDFRRHMYAVIGFELCNEIPLPNSLLKRKITNPDAPRIDCYQIIRQGDQKIPVTPVLYTRNDFDPRVGGNLFKSMEFRLMRLQEKDGKFEPAPLEAGRLMLEPQQIPDFHAQIGRNTKYIIHPDEVLADNFVHLVLGDDKLPSPEIIAGMKNVVAIPEP